MVNGSFVCVLLVLTRISNRIKSWSWSSMAISVRLRSSSRRPSNFSWSLGKLENVHGLRLPATTKTRWLFCMLTTRMLTMLLRHSMGQNGWNNIRIWIWNSGLFIQKKTRFMLRVWDRIAKRLLRRRLGFLGWWRRWNAWRWKMGWIMPLLPFLMSKLKFNFRDSYKLALATYM